VINIDTSIRTIDKLMTPEEIKEYFRLGSKEIKHLYEETQKQLSDEISRWFKDVGQ
jgi:hypothetical protein